MDLLPWTNLVLSQIGLNEIRQDKTRLRTDTKKIVNSLTYFILVAGFIHSIAMLCQPNDVEQLLLISFNIPVFTMTFVCYYFTCTRINSFYNELRMSFARLPRGVQKKIRKRGKWAFLAQVLYWITPSVVSQVLFNENATDQALHLLFINKSSIEKAFFGIFTTFCFSVTLWTIFLYVVSLDAAALCVGYARTKVERIVQRNGITTFAKIQLELEENSRLVKKINSALGMVPLNCFMQLFLGMLLGIFLSCLKDNIKGVNYFKTFGPVLLCYVITLIIVVVMASTTTSVMKETSVLARQITLMQLSRDSPFSVLEERRSLIDYLNYLDCDSFTAGPFFELEPSVLLSFFNISVPSTVMLITTLRDLVLKASSTQKCQPQLSNLKT